MTSPVSDAPPPDARYLLQHEVVRSVAGTPYVVTPTGKGFDLTIDLADARWYGLLSASGMRTWVRVAVTFPRPGSYSLTEHHRSITWRAGVPAELSLRGFSGRTHSSRRQKVWGLAEEGRVRQVVDLRFSSQEMCDLVDEPAQRLGLRHRHGWQVRGAFVAAGFGLALALGVGVAAIVVALT